jgi:hypothetical protein
MIAQLVAGAAKAVRALPDRTDTAVISYQALQALIGILGLALPFVLISVKPFLDGPGIPPSISDYYYTSMRDYFVGSLWAIGIFLSSYRGEKNFHHVFGIIACLCAVGVALFPTTPLGEATTWVGTVHYSCAGVFFGLLAFFSLVVFPAAHPLGKVFHRFCGLVIVGCIAFGMFAYAFRSSDWRAKHDVVFWLELFSVLAFASSWLVKGGVSILSGEKTAAT